MAPSLIRVPIGIVSENWGLEEWLTGESALHTLESIAELEPAI
jgi:hypothetical protein